MNEEKISPRPNASVITISNLLSLLQLVGAGAVGFTGAMSMAGFFFRILEMRGVNVQSVEFWKDHYGSFLAGTALIMAFLMINKYILLRTKNNPAAAVDKDNFESESHRLIN